MNNYIYIKKGSSYKKITFKSLSELKLKLDLDKIEDEENMNLELKQFYDLYCFINPFDIEIHEITSLIWCKNKEASELLYSDLKGNI